MEAEQHWQVIEGMCETQGGEGQRVYGVRVSREGIALDEWTDVADSCEAVAQLARLLQQTCPDPRHWDDIIEDYIHSLY